MDCALAAQWDGPGEENGCRKATPLLGDLVCRTWGPALSNSNARTVAALSLEQRHKGQAQSWNSGCFPLHLVET